MRSMLLISGVWESC